MNTRSILLAIALTPVALTGAAAPARPAEWPARVVTVSGKAELWRKDAPVWSAATLRAEVGPGDVARTLGGRLTLRTASGQALRLAPSSRLALLEGGAAEQPTRVRIDGGSVWVAVMPASPPAEQIEVQAGALSCTVKGSGVGITLARDGSVLVRVYHGAAECAGGAERRWNRTVVGEQEILVPSGGAPADVRALIRDKPDAAWVKWNEEQDFAGGYGGKPPAPR